MLLPGAAPIVCVRGLPSTVHALLDYERCVAPGVCGNKARKLASLRLSAGERVVSHGGGQSNAMLALASLCHEREAQLTYHTRPQPRWLRDRPTGNLRRALSLGMQLSEAKSAAEYEAACARAARSTDAGLFVPQGAAWPGAESGVAGLAHEIGDWWEREHSPLSSASAFSSASASPPPLSVVVPAGTGTTALFLARHAPPYVRVFAVPCVGGSEVLTAQMTTLDQASGCVGTLPEVLEPPATLRTPFATPSAAVLAAWRDAALSHALLLDLVYGAIAWGTLAECGFAPSSGRGRGGGSAGSTSDGGGTLYVHCGGLEGLGTSLRRYARSGLLMAGESAEAALAAAREAAGVESSLASMDTDS